MSPYITFKEDLNGELALYILQREWPHYVASLDYHPTQGEIAQVPMAGHNIFVTFRGTIRGRFLPAQQNVVMEVENVMQSMATWFYESRIMKDPRRYKKWAIHS